MESKNQTITIERNVLISLLNGYMEKNLVRTRFDILVKCFKKAELDCAFLMFRALESCDPCALSSGCVYAASAYLVTNTVGAINTPMFSNGTFQQEDVARYACITGSGDNICNLVMEPESVSKRLGISSELIDHLGVGRVVIAGGAAMYMGCPKSLWDLSCDVDIFVLDVDHPVDSVMDIVLTLQSEGYIVCQSGSAVLTAIGEYGTRRVQIIKSSAKTPTELIEKFDLNVTKAFYDGIQLTSTYSAVLDWSDMRCRNGSFTPLKPTRLARAFLKGFELCDVARKQLTDTIGWPLTEEVKNKLLYNIPCLTAGLPANVQCQLLINIGLTPVGNGSDISIGVDGQGLVPMGNSYGPIGIFTGSMEEFIETVEVDNVEYLPNRNMLNGIQIFPLKTRYLVSLPLCSFPFSWSVNEDVDKPTKLSIVDNKEEKKFCEWHDAICNKIMPYFQVDTLNKKFSDVRIGINKKCIWWKNGIKRYVPFDIKSGDLVRVVGKANHITFLKGKDMYIKFDILNMYVHSSEPLYFSDVIKWDKVEADDVN